MTIDEAIAKLQELSEALEIDVSEEESSACLLGIEALKQVKESRFDSLTWEPKTLLGETED